MEIKLVPWTVPNFATLAFPSEGEGSGSQPTLPTVPISKIDALELEELCEKFRAEVFRKAGKEDPANCRPRAGK